MVRSKALGILLHTDADREWAHDRKSDVGRLDEALDAANAKGWQPLPGARMSDPERFKSSTRN